MTNTELIQVIKAEIERLQATNPSEYNCENAVGYMWALNDLLSFLSALELEKHVPSNLFEAKHAFSEKRFPDEKMAPLRRAARIGYEAGAKWQREQMVREAVEADVNIYKDLAAGKSWAEFVVEMPTNNLGDKVRIIIVKEDNHE